MDTTSASEDEVDVAEISTFRIRLYLNSMLQKRALYGIQPDDADEAVAIAWESLRTAQESKDEIAIARASFWLGTALYYSDDLPAARGHFLEANKLTILPPYEAGYVGVWIERCNEGGPEKDASDYAGLADPSQASRGTQSFLSDLEALKENDVPNVLIPTKNAQGESGTTPSNPVPQTEEQGKLLEATESETYSSVKQSNVLGDMARQLAPSRW